MVNKIKCFDKSNICNNLVFIEDKYTLTKKIKPKDHYTLVMMLPGMEDYKTIQHFVFD